MMDQRPRRAARAVAAKTRLAEKTKIKTRMTKKMMKIVMTRTMAAKN